MVVMANHDGIVGELTKEEDSHGCHCPGRPRSQQQQPVVPALARPPRVTGHRVSGHHAPDPAVQPAALSAFISRKPLVVEREVDRQHHPSCMVTWEANVCRLWRVLSVFVRQSQAQGPREIPLLPLALVLAVQALNPEPWIPGGCSTKSRIRACLTLSLTLACPSSPSPASSGMMLASKLAAKAKIGLPTGKRGVQAFAGQKGRIVVKPHHLLTSTTSHTCMHAFQIGMPFCILICTCLPPPLSHQERQCIRQATSTGSAGAGPRSRGVWFIRQLVSCCGGRGPCIQPACALLRIHSQDDRGRAATRARRDRGSCRCVASPLTTSTPSYFLLSAIGLTAMVTPPPQRASATWSCWVWLPGPLPPRPARAQACQLDPLACWGPPRACPTSPCWEVRGPHECSYACSPKGGPCMPIQCSCRSPLLLRVPLTPVPARAAAIIVFGLTFLEKGALPGITG